MDWPDKIYAVRYGAEIAAGTDAETIGGDGKAYVRVGRFAEILQQIDDCAMYLKPGETPRQRMDRDHGDVQALLQLLEKEKRKNEEKL